MSFPPVYLIADPSLYPQDQGSKGTVPETFFQVIETAISAGVRFIQYRDKSGERGRIFETAKKIRKITRHRDVCFIVNDEIDIALAVEAEGVHLGQEDFPISMARKLLKKGAIVGLSTHTLSQAIEAESAGADYIGFGPIFATQTKTAENLPVGIQAITGIREKVTIPIYAIGGIQLSQVQHILAAGAAGVALASALVNASKETLQEWLKYLSLSSSSESNTLIPE